MTKRLGWTFAPMLALAVVTLTAADDRLPVTSSSTSTSASTTALGTPRPSGAGGPRASLGSRNTRILGSAWNSDNTPIKSANVRLRNVVSGKIEAVAKANEAGQFTFEHVEGGNYAVELVTDSGHTVAIGNVFTISQGETVATFVRLGPKVPWTAALFSNTAGNVSAIAATEGIAAIRPAGNCQSPPCQ